MEIYMMKVATQSSGENMNFPLNVVKKNGQPWEEVKIGPILHIKHKNKIQMYQRSKSKNNETMQVLRGKIRGELFYNLSIWKGVPV